MGPLKIGLGLVAFALPPMVLGASGPEDPSAKIGPVAAARAAAVVAPAESVPDTAQPRTVRVVLDSPFGLPTGTEVTEVRKTPPVFESRATAKLAAAEAMDAAERPAKPRKAKARKRAEDGVYAARRMPPSPPAPYYFSYLR